MIDNSRRFLQIHTDREKDLYLYGIIVDHFATLRSYEIFWADSLSLDPILVGVLVSLYFGWGRQKGPTSVTLEIYILLTWNMVHRLIQDKNSWKMSKKVCPLCEFCWCQHFLTVMLSFLWKMKIFKISALIWWKSYLWGYIMVNLMLFKF